MYHMKRIIPSGENIMLPKCMYTINNSMKFDSMDDTEINICDQVIKFLKKSNSPLMELEERQDKLLLKLDTLYERIKNISLLSKSTSSIKNEKIKIKTNEFLGQEIVLTFSPDVLPWFLNIFLKKLTGINVSWHIHSSVKNDIIPKLNNFLNKFQHTSICQAKINMRLIFTNVQSAPELKISSLDIPIIGTVNIIRFLCLNFKDIVSYDFTDYNLEGLLDLCFLLERVSDKNKESIFKKLFSNYKNWIYKNEFTIVDLAAYNVVKQSQNSVKYVPKQWYENCYKKID